MAQQRKEVGRSESFRGRGSIGKGRPSVNFIGSEPDPAPFLLLSEKALKRQSLVNCREEKRLQFFEAALVCSGRKGGLKGRCFLS